MGEEWVAPFGIRDSRTQNSTTKASLPNHRSHFDRPATEGGDPLHRRPALVRTDRGSAMVARLNDIHESGLGSLPFRFDRRGCASEPAVCRVGARLL